jgi:amidase
MSAWDVEVDIPQGSVRGPSAFCGIYGYKATSETLPMKDFLATSFAAECKDALCATI